MRSRCSLTQDGHGLFTLGKWRSFIAPRIEGRLLWIIAHYRSKGEFENQLAILRVYTPLQFWAYHLLGKSAVFLQRTPKRSPTHLLSYTTLISLMWMVGCNVIIDMDLPKEVFESCERHSSMICHLIFSLDEFRIHNKGRKVGAEIAVKN
jgi:hypothetical protein